MQVSIRAYGWFCIACDCPKPVEKVRVVKAPNKEFIGVICNDCSTELHDCFLYKKGVECDSCKDRFHCFTMSGATVPKPLENVKSHEIQSIAPIKTDNKSMGIKSYTGHYHYKLDQSYCAYPYRDDCNHSWMRANYSGTSYTRCEYMEYAIKEEKWYCLYGETVRGNR